MLITALRPYAEQNIHAPSPHRRSGGGLNYTLLQQLTLSLFGGGVHINSKCYPSTLPLFGGGVVFSEEGGYTP